MNSITVQVNICQGRTCKASLVCVQNRQVNTKTASTVSKYFMHHRIVHAPAAVSTAVPSLLAHGKHTSGFCLMYIFAGSATTANSINNKATSCETKAIIDRLSPLARKPSVPNTIVRQTGREGYTCSTTCRAVWSSQSKNLQSRNKASLILLAAKQGQKSAAWQQNLPI